MEALKARFEDRLRDVKAKLSKSMPHGEFVILVQDKADFEVVIKVLDEKITMENM